VIPAKKKKKKKRKKKGEVIDSKLPNVNCVSNIVKEIDLLYIDRRYVYT